MPKVSIIVPVYNVEKYIRQCIESILSQSFKDFELILVDDGSPDNCPAICDEYAKRDERVKVIHKENGGVSAARNTGIAASSGEWIYLVDSDDWIEGDAIEHLYREAVEQDVDCVITDGMERYSSGSNKRLRMYSQPFRTEDKDMIKRIQKSVLCHKYSPYFSPGADNEYPAPWTKFIKRTIITDNGLKFDPYVLGHYDDGLFTMYLLEKVNSIYYDGRHSYNYRIVTGTMTRNFNKRAMEFIKRNSERMDQFIKETRQDEDFKQAEYCRRVTFFAAYQSMYFFNPNNPADAKTVRRELLDAINTYPFGIAIRKAKVKNFENKHKYVLMCGKLKFIRGLELYAKLKQKYRPY